MSNLKTVAHEAQSLQLKKLSIDNSDTIIYCNVSTKKVRPYISRNLRRRIFNITYGLAYSSGHVTRKMIGQQFGQR